jgi:hypothetical protein
VYILLGILFSGFFIAAGVLFLYGTWQRWPFFVDPPEEWWPFYSQAFIKKVFGRSFLIASNYFLGALFITAALIGLWNGLKN